MITTEMDDKKVKIVLNHIKDASKDMNLIESLFYPEKNVIRLS